MTFTPVIHSIFYFAARPSDRQVPWLKDFNILSKRIRARRQIVVAEALV